MVRFSILKQEERKQNRHLIQNGQDDYFVFSFEVKEKYVFVDIEKYRSLGDAFHDLSFLTEYLIRHYHPCFIKIRHPDPQLFKVIQSVGYYQSGKDCQWIKDPDRDILKDSVFDEEGYIIDQGSMKDIPFGWFTTMEKGCGWIAAYNLLKMNGKPKQIREVISDLEKHNFLGKVFGQDVFFLYLYLKKCKLDVSVSLPGKQGCLRALQECECGILLYQHSRGGHYAAFDKADQNRVHFYNAVYRKKDHITSLEQFIDTHCILNACWIISCKKRQT